MIRLIFTEETRERLRHERIHHPHPRVRQRLEALYLKSEGRSHQAICASLGITKPTLIGYLRLYQEGRLGGADGVSVSSDPERSGTVRGVDHHGLRAETPADPRRGQRPYRRFNGDRAQPGASG